MKNELVKAGAKIGALVGGILWLLFGILGGFYFGGYATISIMSKLMGSSIEPTLITRAIVVMGMAIGITTAGTVCLVTGGLLGAFFGWVVSPIKRFAKQTN